jgi:DNA-binding NarL/FixJ family response regulator
MPLRCLIVDDSPQFLRAARALLEREGIAVVGVASTGAEALQRAEELQPDVTLVDLDLGDESGFDLARRLEEETTLEPSSVILVSTCAEEDFADLIATSPAAGFLAKSQLSAPAIRELLGVSSDGDRPEPPKADRHELP